METKRIRLGFIALSDAAPLIVAVERGFFAVEGVEASLVREVSWATIRDKVAAGALDGAQMLAPAVIAAALGVGGEAHPLIAPLALNRNGAAITLSTALASAISDGLAPAFAGLRAASATPPTLAVVFPYSMHNYLLRHWLAEGGVDPDKDVRIVVTPPSRTAAQLAAGELDGFCAGEPWPTLAVMQGAGVVVARATDLFPDGPEKVLGVSRVWADENPETLQAVLRAVLRAGQWCDAPENHSELADLLARPEWLDTPADAILPGLGGIAFHAGQANAPMPVHAGWLISQMMRWGQVGPIDVRAAAEAVFRHDLYREAAAGLGWTAANPGDPALFPGPGFTLDAADAYAAAQPMSRVAAS